ncbi:MAG TPA: threonine synthase [Opitutae bacterium]|nr:threonine synthase [Opitutaceae bacterium]HCR29781.1 threonine synthase [Opitutae bacterium]
MKFVSTRAETEPRSFSEAVKIGLAPDGGLFVPSELPDLSEEFSAWEGESYPTVCYRFFKHFATDIEDSDLESLIFKAYSTFDNEHLAPLIKLDDRISVLELFHGPTLAFKDYALQLLGRLYERQVALTGEAINVLGATSGDTGAAAINGLLGRSGVNIFILYPDGRISSLQERQMACTGESNVFPIAVEGSFDDAQRELKAVFGDRAFSQSTKLSAVNSINLARILAQCVYYIYACLQISEERRENTVFVVPTGNFGNVLAGWMASRMGMKVAGFRVATNQNDILNRFFNTGEYAVGSASQSLAPSMDIQVASNFERFLYYALGEDGHRVRGVMANFSSTGVFRADDQSIVDSMSSSRMTDAEICETIESVYQKYGYICDPHTACAFKDLKAFEHSVILATAHPAKFPETVLEATGQTATHRSLEKLKSREIVKYPLHADANTIKAFIESKQTTP